MPFAYQTAFNRFDTGNTLPVEAENPRDWSRLVTLRVQKNPCRRLSSRHRICGHSRYVRLPVVPIQHRRYKSVELRTLSAKKMKGKIVDGEARERLIVWMRRRMEEFGITLDALEASIQEELDHPPLYRDARGNDWNGVGDMPDWLKAAKHAGVDPDFFRVAPEHKREAETEASLFRTQVDLFDS